MDVVELSEMIAIAFLAGCGVIMAWRQTARSNPETGAAAVSPAAMVTAMFAGILVLELLLIYHR